MATAPNISPTWSASAQRLHDSMLKGAILHWTPIGGFVLQLPSGKLTKPRLGTVWIVRRARLITTDDHDGRQPHTWRSVGRQGIAR